jgi:hypothetical protein
MKNKTITYLLIGIVILVWGWIFYKIFSSFHASGSSPQLEIISHQQPRDEQQPIKEFSLKANYRDPFLGKDYREVVPQKKSDRTKLKPEIKVDPIPTINWSFIRYMGLIKNPDSGKKIALISVHNKELMISEGETISEVKCIKHYRDSIKVSYQGKVACIKR